MATKRQVRKYMPATAAARAKDERRIGKRPAARERRLKLPDIKRAQLERERQGIQKFLDQVERLAEINGTLWAERMSAYYKRRLERLEADLKAPD